MVIKAFAGIIDQDPTLTRKTRDYFGFTYSSAFRRTSRLPRSCFVYCVLSKQGETNHYPAYHMNKLHLVSVLLPDALDDVVRFLVNISFEATKDKRKRRKTAE